MRFFIYTLTKTYVIRYEVSNLLILQTLSRQINAPVIKTGKKGDEMYTLITRIPFAELGLEDYLVRRDF